MAPMLSNILTALSEGATAITPNRRLARFLQRAFDRVQQTAGRKSWPTPTVLPYPTWLQTLWQDCAADGEPQAAKVLLNPSQSAFLWRRVVEAHAPALLLDTHGAAELAEEAWSLTQAWGAGAESWRAWKTSDAGDSNDALMFANWAEAYLAELRRAEALDTAQLADVLARNTAHLDMRSMRVVLVGFIKLTPQQQRLLDALQAGGAEIRALDSELPPAVDVSRTIAATPREEIRVALEWARERVLIDGLDNVGIVIDDLAQRREEIVAHAEDILCPALVLPTQAATRRPFEVSLGTPLAAVPLVIAALDLIGLLEDRLQRGDASALLRSPYLGGSETAWARRAGVEREWLSDGRREIVLDDAIAALERSTPELAERWKSWRQGRRPVRVASPREWVDVWRDWLGVAGWPGSRTLDSAEHQAREAWESVLANFAALGAVAPRIERSAAVQAIGLLARDRVFQPEGGLPSVQLLGLLEGAGLEFDALWVAGLSADRWPRAPNPNPLLPLHWQRQHNVPRATAQGELEYAQSLTDWFAAAAPVVVFSSPASSDDHRLLPSALLLRYPEAAPATGAVPWIESIARAARLETIVDDRAPAIEAGSRAPGGAGIIAMQSDCPFRAVARYRLGVDSWPFAPAGLLPEERGALAHGSLAAFWNGVHDQATLSGLDRDELLRRIRAAVNGALSQIGTARRESVPPVVRRAEAGRLEGVLNAWIALELERPAFVVGAVESITRLSLGPLTFALRLDRIDQLEDGGIVIIDYKTGQVVPPRQWFDERPQAPQLGMYGLAQRAAFPELPVRALAYGRLKSDAIGPIGIATEAHVWPRLTELQELRKFADWAALEEWWRSHLGSLADEIAAGCATVTPRRYPSPCRSCRLHALCRIESVRMEESDNGDA